MTHHSEAIAAIVTAIEDDTIGGAADMARQVSEALRAAAADQSLPDFREEIAAAAHEIRRVSPGIMPVERVLSDVVAAVDETDDPRSAVTRATLNFEAWLDTAFERLATFGARLLQDGDRLFLYSMSSSVYSVIDRAASEGLRLSIATTESRPGNEGLSTISRFEEAGIEVTAGLDAGMVQLMRGCTSAWIGADSVTSLGQCLVKVGSYAAALTAAHYQIPLFVAADTSKFDVRSLAGAPPEIREFPATDVVPGDLPANGRVRNPVFEVVPAHLVAGYVTEVGVMAPASVYAVMREMPGARQAIASAGSGTSVQ